MKHSVLIHNFLENSAERLAGKTAVVGGDIRLTYGDLQTQCNRLANALIDRGVRRGDRVCIYMDNSTGPVLGLFGILTAGAAFVMVNPLVKTDKLAYMLSDSGAVAVLTEKKYMQRVCDAAKDIDAIKTIIVNGIDQSENNELIIPMHEALAAQNETHPGVPVIDMDLSAIMYTSGSTGRPKGVAVTHANMVSAATSVITYIENVESDIILSALSLAFSYGLYQALMSAQVGMTVILEKSFAFPYRVVQHIEQERVTGFPGVPTAFALLLRMKDIQDRDFSSVRYLTNAGAALPVPHLKRVREVFKNAKLFNMYGLTEVKRASYMPPEELDARPDSVGRAIPNEEIYILREDGTPAPPGETGELVVRGRNVMCGYWNMPEETERVLRPGRYPWEKVFHTGDLFKMDDEGFFFFVSRKDDIIKSRGEKVSPQEVESAIYELDAVAEAAVIGVDHEILGQAIKAYIALRDGAELTAKQVLVQCKKKLEAFMVPQEIEFVDEVPKTATGKIRRASLRKREAEK